MHGVLVVGQEKSFLNEVNVRVKDHILTLDSMNHKVRFMASTIRCLGKHGICFRSAVIATECRLT